MRVVVLIALFILMIAVLTFILQNFQAVEIRFLGWSQQAPLALVTLGLYGLGMLTGGAVIGLLRRSFRAIRERPPQ